MGIPFPILAAALQRAAREMLHLLRYFRDTDRQRVMGKGPSNAGLTLAIWGPQSFLRERLESPRRGSIG